MAARSQNAKPAHDAVRHDVPTRLWTVLAQDPGLLGINGEALTTTVSVPAERLERGPKGHRIHVIDYDASADIFYRARDTNVELDPYAGETDIDKLVRDPYFHQQSVYAIAMATLCEFEGALGRPVNWGFAQPSHQLKISPHAFADANAYYSRESESLNFGYFPNKSGQTIYTCLSHDIVVHETTHALLDGLRPFYFTPSSTDQAAFHEGFSDIVALLSVFRSEEIVQRGLAPIMRRDRRIEFAKLTEKELARTSLARLAEQMGVAMEGVPSAALRASLDIEPDRGHYKSSRFAEEHDRGELLVAVVIRAFLRTWVRRLEPLRETHVTGINVAVVAEEGAAAARQLLRVCIRALDYLPPVDLTFRDYLSALLTADLQLNPDGDRYRYRATLKETFAAYGIDPANEGREDGAWNPPMCETGFSMTGVHFERMQRDPTEVFRFIWENRDALGIEPNAFTRVTSVRPVVRISNDRMVLRETVVEYVQTLKVWASQLKSLGIEKPAGMRSSRLITLYGGGSLIFNEFGSLKFHIGTGVRSAKQSDRLRSLWKRGYFQQSKDASARIARMHRDRVLRPVRALEEGW